MYIYAFKGAFPDSQAHNDSVASRGSSLSDTEGDIPNDSSSIKDFVDISSSGNTVQNSPGDNSEESSILGGVWLCKQPSLSEGLDIVSSDEEEIDGMTPDGDASMGTPQAPTEQSNKKADQNEEEGQDDVFTHDTSESLEKELADISDKQDRSSSTEPPQWLVRAISICSEGEDLEVLASEANEEELSFPQAFSDYSYCEEKEQSTIDNSIRQEEEEDQFTNSQDSSHRLGATLDTLKSLEQGSKTNTSKSVVCETGLNCKTVIIPCNTSHSTNDVLPETSDSSCSPKDSNFASRVDDRQSCTGVKRDAGNKKVVRQRTVSDLTNICIDPKESDYLYAAGHTIHKALDCEVNGNYEEAFSLYKTCVGLLLSGVQGEKDVKRREAVRRKTAQYLLKAEALYNTYLAGNDSSEKSEDSSISHAGDLSQSDDLQKFKDLTLADLKVMGIVGKVMLVENKNTGETFVVKALCKSGQTKPNNGPQGSVHKRKKSVRHLYGKYPNIVQLYRYFETATSIYLLLEYARGGRLWDHLSCYQQNKESQDNLIQSVNRKFTNLKKSADVEHVTLDEENAAPLSQNSVTHPDKQVALSDKKAENRTSNERNSQTLQDTKNSLEVTQIAVEQLDTTGNGNDCNISLPPSCNNEEQLTENKDLEESKDTHDRQSLFVKLDEYFTSSSQDLPDEHKRVWAAELVLAVAYLHTAGIICRDLHPENVLLDEEGHILLTYFGAWEETDHILDKTAMNHFYCAPEVWQVDDITPAADWWSVGALLYEIITGQALAIAHPWGIKTHTELHLHNKISPEAKSLLRELLRVTPSERLGSGVNGVEEIKSHPYFSGVNWAWLCSRINQN